MESKFKVGDRVRIVNKRGSHWNPWGEMDKWMGQVVTIKSKSIDSDYYCIKEDNFWAWRELDFELIERVDLTEFEMIEFLRKNPDWIARYKDSLHYVKFNGEATLSWFNEKNEFLKYFFIENSLENSKWTVSKPLRQATWQEAMEVWLNGKTIKLVVNEKAYIFYGDSCNFECFLIEDIEKLRPHYLYKNDFVKGKWYIVD